MKKILVTPRPFNDSGKAYLKKLKEKGFEVISNDTGKRFSQEEFLDKIKDVNGIILGNEDLSADSLKVAKKLQIISKYGVGLDNVDEIYAKTKGIAVCKALGSNTVSVAEMAMLFMLSSSRRFSQLINKEAVKEHQRIIGSELKGKTLGIIGFGAIGRQVAEYAKSFFMKIVAYDPYAANIPEEVEIVELEELLKIADLLSLHLPLTAETENFFNDDKFDLIEAGTIVINTSRAELVSEDSLKRWLTISDDNFYAEDVEIGKRSETLSDFENYLMTPHAASFTREADQNMMVSSVQNIISFFEKSGLVNK